MRDGSDMRKIVLLPSIRVRMSYRGFEDNTIVFRHTNELRNYSLTHTTKVLYLQL